MIEGTIADARRGIGDAKLTLDSAADGSPLAAPRARTLVREFTERATGIVALVEADRPAAARRATGRLDTGFADAAHLPAPPPSGDAVA